MRKVSSFKEYRELISYRIEAAEEKGYKTKMAAGCKIIYLSQVMIGTVHLTLEHAHGIATFWGLNALETDFFLLLVNQERAGSLALRRYYSEKLKLVKHDALDV